MTDKELRILDEMLTNLEIWSTWNKTFANEMIGICSKMRNLLADRKTENSSEKPNNCEWSVEYAKEMLDTMPCEECGHWEHGAGDHHYCALSEMRQECYFESKGESTLMFANKPKDEPTISKMEQVDKDINVRSKTEPQTMLNDGTLVINVEDATKVSRVLVGDNKNRGDLYYPDDEDEPQTETQTETQNSNLTFEKDECAKEYEELGLKELKELINADRKTEPQTDCAWR